MLAPARQVGVCGVRVACELRSSGSLCEVGGLQLVDSRVGAASGPSHVNERSLAQPTTSAAGRASLGLLTVGYAGGRSDGREDATAARQACRSTRQRREAREQLTDLDRADCRGRDDPKMRLTARTRSPCRRPNGPVPSGFDGRRRLSAYRESAKANTATSNPNTTIEATSHPRDTRVRT